MTPSTYFRGFGASAHQKGRQTEFLVRLSHFAQTLVVRCHFHPVAAGAHATPPPAVIFGGVIEEEDTRRVLALLDQVEVRVAKQIAR